MAEPLAGRWDTGTDLIPCWKCGRTFELPACNLALVGQYRRIPCPSCTREETRRRGQPDA